MSWVAFGSVFMTIVPATVSPKAQAPLPMAFPEPRAARSLSSEGGEGMNPALGRLVLGILVGPGVLSYRTVAGNSGAIGGIECGLRIGFVMRRNTDLAYEFDVATTGRSTKDWWETRHMVVVRYYSFDRLHLQAGLGGAHTDTGRVWTLLRGDWGWAGALAAGLDLVKASRFRAGLQVASSVAYFPTLGYRGETWTTVGLGAVATWR